MTEAGRNGEGRRGPGCGCLAFLGAVGTAVVGVIVGVVLQPSAEELKGQLEGELLGRQPVGVRVASDADRAIDGWRWATPKPVDVTTAPPQGGTCDDALRWAVQAKGLPVGETWLEVILTGRRTGVVITGMHASTKKTEPYSGSLIACPGRRAIPDKGIGFDLDSSNVLVARSSEPDGELGKPYFAGRTISLAKGETKTIGVVGKANRYLHRWTIELTVVVDGEEKTFPIGDPEGYWTVGEAPKYSSSWNWDSAQQPSRLVPASQEESDGDCGNRTLTSVDRDALPEAANATKPALPESVYFGSCGEESWAVARFPGPPESGVFRNAGEGWAFLGTAEVARCEVPSELRGEWRLDPC